MMNQSFECFDHERSVQQIAGSLSCALRQVDAAVSLLETGNTIPFIARYRKEVTGGLDEIALRKIEDAFGKARELAQRKTCLLYTSPSPRD